MNTAKTARWVTLTATLLLAGTAQAVGTDEVRYPAQLARCLDALRVDLVDAETTRIRYTVKEIEKRGAWYQFDIESEMYHEADASPVRAMESRCRVHRWSAATEITG